MADLAGFADGQDFSAEARSSAERAIAYADKERNAFGGQKSFARDWEFRGNDLCIHLMDIEKNGK